MAKINLSDHKFVVFFAALFSGVLAFVVLRGLLLNPGIIESIDIQWNQYVNMFALWFHTWNFYSNGSQIIFVSQFPIYSWVLVLQNVALAQRFVYFSIVSLVSFSMFLVTFYTLKRTVQKTVHIYLGSIVASLFYTLNPLVISELFHISFLWAYSLFPLVFYFGWESFNDSSRQKVLVGALLLSMFFAFMADAWGMLVGLLILIIVAISSAVLNGRKNFVRKFVPNCLLTLLIMGIVTVLLAAYWLLPFITQKTSEPVWDPFSVANLVINSQDSSLIRIFGLHSWSSQPFLNSSTGTIFFDVWQCATLFLPIFAILAVLVRRSKLTLTLSGLLVVGFFLATGVKYAEVSGYTFKDGLPFGNLYLWLAFYSPKIISVQTFLLKYPYVFLALASLSSSILAAVFVSSVFGKVKFDGNALKRKFSKKSYVLPTVLLLSTISLIALVGWPLLTGNLNGALEPVTLPTQYKELNNFFASQNGTFRVMWVPQEANFNWSNNPWANKVEYWGSGVPPLFYGWGIVTSPNNGFLGNMIYDYLLNNQTQYLGKLLALGNVRFIVFHNDSALANGDPALAPKAFERYFKQYTDYFNSFLNSTEYTYHFLSVDKTTGGTIDGGYLNFILKQEYIENYKNSSGYQALISPEGKAHIDSLSKLTSINASTIFDSLNQKLFDIYNTEEQYKNSSFYKNLPNSRVYLNKFLNSTAYQDYLNSYSSLNMHQKFMDSPIYNNSHNYLDSIEYLILTGSQYFANSTENLGFINSVEYKAFLYYYLYYTEGKYADLSYQNFQDFSEYKNYLAYLNYNRLNYQEIFNNLQAQKDLKLVPFSSDNLFVFENMEMMNYFQAYSKANLVVGGLDTIGSLSSIDDFYLNDSAFLFVENQPISESNLTSILASTDLDKTLIFHDNKTFNDLVLDTIDTGSWIAPSEVFIETNANGWLKDAVTSYSWTPLTLGSYTGQKYDFGLGHNLLYTAIPGAYFDIPAKVDKSGNYSIWLRVLFSPRGGNLTLSIDNVKVGEPVNTNCTTLTGFNWVNLAHVTLDAGSHTLRFTSEIGLNAINLVALPTVTELEEHGQTLTDLINQSSAQIAYVVDRPFLNSAENEGFISFFAPKNSSYMINFQANQLLSDSALDVKVDNVPLIVTSTDSFSDSPNWYSIGPVDLSQGSHVLNLNFSNIEKIIIFSLSKTKGSSESLKDVFGNGAEPYVRTYEKTGPVSFSVVVNASKGFILGFQESHDEFWQLNISSTRLSLNSVNNGFFVDSNSSLNAIINITYSPEQSFQLGLKITLISFLATLTIICVVLFYPRIRSKSAVQKRPFSA